ncbi:hypothetical protein CgunFtcFv8_022098 [Champsocephalus gunnari]|uniref:Uncharacterized protein n=1 Tax=Champsocephalus gunnari TaxID=52237 RepID=A0AAN8DW37_CHAGU|nr:hypothetical protein CgunFtcFv8_022098 [Champsocephalus gunnari]
MASGPKIFSSASIAFSSVFAGWSMGTHSRKAWGPGLHKATQEEICARTSSGLCSELNQSGVSTSATCRGEERVGNKPN